MKKIRRFGNKSRNLDGSTLIMKKKEHLKNMGNGILPSWTLLLKVWLLALSEPMILPSVSSAPDGWKTGTTDRHIKSRERIENRDGLYDSVKL